MESQYGTHPPSITTLFARQVRSAPERIAVRGEDAELTYRQLDRRSDHLARHLQDRGVRPGDVVALDADRRAATAVALLGILKAGAAYLALERRYPAERRRLILADSGAAVVLTRDDLDAIAEGPAPEPVTTAPDDVAYIAYTSGSTGAPKGVRVPHRAVLRLVVDADFLTLGPDDVVLQYAPVAFDASTLEIWGPLLNGARLDVAPERDLAIGELTKHISHFGITVLWLTAGLFQQVVEYGLDDLGGVRVLLAGGDVLSPPHVNQALAALPGLTLVNGYGPTENTTFTCCHTITAPVEGAVPIGRPIRGTGVHLLDADLRPVPDGEVGELYATGDGLALGYLGNPEETTRAFLPDPFDDRPGARMYRTGDLVSRRPDGVLDYHGRADRQVKIRGFRIEPGEIEAALAARDDIAEAAVVAQPGPDGGKRLVAFVTGRGGVRPATLAVRRELGEVLPSYAVPSHLRVVDALPLTANGKVDRAALTADISPARPELNAAHRPPAPGIEAAVAQLWSDHLGIDGIGADDDFFELGGHSLVGVRITADLEREYGVQISPVTFYLAPTPAGLAAAVVQAGGAR
ncbi:non-ribosomal peptide synthetase [Streptomyces sp. RS10V-4]|uniref:non-ribosomal peptide synthetase n=1 Tax=Streptomyces rhizoryzae TaxID=2932493 RepID=UPI0020035792|nr:non-ribosomal peptide synthetase [Streptomyces rhizoryzae]MCK7621809.1 non-ribosomal peptide synthetase [Streptomyces rhizoryzae]